VFFELYSTLKGCKK